MVIPNNRKSKKSHQKHLRNTLEVYVWHWSQCLQCLSVILTIPCSLLLAKRASGAGIRVKEGQSLCWMYWTVPVAQVLPNFSTNFVSMKDTYRCVALGDCMACIQALYAVGCIWYPDGLDSEGAEGEAAQGDPASKRSWCLLCRGMGACLSTLDTQTLVSLQDLRYLYYSDRARSAFTAVAAGVGT
jgi:hypothetical protein